MADIQKHLEKFHAAIYLTDVKKKDLRRSRDALLEKVRKSLREADESRPTFRVVNQGSYLMGTMVKPLPGEDWDIDVGLHFNTTTGDHSAATIRRWVLDAVKDHTAKPAENKTSCIRVWYAVGYHVDLVVYAQSPDGVCLASKVDGWQPSDPGAIRDYLNTARARFRDTEDAATKTDQLRRVIRMLKRWNDVRFQGSSGSSNKPSGLAWTVAAVEALGAPSLEGGLPNDARALRIVVSWLMDQYGSGGTGRSRVYKPSRQEDLLAKLSSGGHKRLWKSLAEFGYALDEAISDPDPHHACQVLAAELGDAMDVPSKASVAAVAAAPTILGSSTSA